MKTLSLEQAIFEVIKDFDNKGQPFSAHDITTIVRNKVNAKDFEILNVPYGYVDATNTHSQQISHVDVRDIIREMVDNNEVDVVSRGAYTIYRYKTVTPVLGTMPVIQKIVDMPPSLAPTPTARKNLADLLASVTDTAATTSPAVTGVPSRFLVKISDEDRQHITQYVRNKLTQGFCPTLRSVQKVVKSKGVLTVENVKQVVVAEGWKVNEGYAGKPLSYQTITL